MRFIAIAGLGASVVLTACAPTSDSPTQTASGSETARRCFSTLQVQNFQQGRSNEVYLRVGRNDVYRLDAMAGCDNLDFANRLAIVSDFGGAGSDRVCSDDMVRVIVPGVASPADV
ncbi:MAG TPA: DUF6491 family protein, partial [Brevundimonas sp.]|nr:DUF6491 family protein [Brevundimonas sp.]